METVDATTLKNRLGAVLERAALAPIAIERHGRVVAHLVPVPQRDTGRRPRTAAAMWNRTSEQRAVDLAVSGDYRPSRWLRAGDAGHLAGVCMMLASHPRFDRARMLALAERLQPGIAKPAQFDRWLRTTPVQAERFMRLVDAALRERAHFA